MELAEAAQMRRQYSIAAKLDADQMAHYQRAVAAAGVSSSAFIRRAVLQQTIPLRPFEPLMAESISVLAFCRQAVRAGTRLDERVVQRLDQLIDALHRLADARA